MLKLNRLSEVLKKLVKFVQNNLLIVIGVLLLLWWMHKGGRLVENFSDADIKTGTKVHLKTGGGKFLSICEGSKCGNCCINSVCIQDENQGDKSTFELHVHNEKDMKVSLKSQTADYLFECEGCCGSNCRHVICADSGNVNAENGIFTIVKNENKYMLRAHNGKIVQLCTECNPDCRLLCAKDVEDLTMDNLALELVVA